MRLTKRIKDAYHLRMFKLFYKQLEDETDNTTRFVRALVLSSDRHLETKGKEAQIKEWYREYQGRKGRKNE